MQLIIAGLIWITRTGRPWVICRHRRPLQFKMILMWHHPKYYKEMERKRKQLEKERELASEQANKLESERASRRVGGPTSREPTSDQASDEEASKQR